MKDWQKQFDEKFALENTWTGKKQFQVIISAYTKDIKSFIEDELKNQIPDEAASADAINLDDLDDKMKDYESGLVEGWNSCRDKMLRSI